MANIYSNIMAGTMDAYASVVSNNLNIIMKVLTILTIIMTIPNIVFGFFGMNIGEGQIPGDWVWWMPLAITVVGCFFAWWMLKKKVNTLWIILVIFVVGILGYFTGILGYVG